MAIMSADYQDRDQLFISNDMLPLLTRTLTYSHSFMHKIRRHTRDRHARLYKDFSRPHLNMRSWGSNLEQIEDLLAQVQLKVRVVGARHVVDEHQAVPLGLKAVGI